jgi:hypothetical protein
MTGHMHSILYCDNIQLKIMEQEYLKIVAKYKLEKTVCEVLHSKKASSYVYKYLLKNSLPSDDGNSLFNKYKSYFSNIRIFSSSNFEHTNQAEIDKVYKYISKYRPLLMKYLKRSDTPLYIKLEELILNGYFSFEYKIITQVVVNKKLLEDTTTTIFYNEFIPLDDEEIQTMIFQSKNQYVKTVNIKKLIKAYFVNRYTKDKQLIYDSSDFVAIQKTDFNDEFFGIYEDEPVF